MQALSAQSKEYLSRLTADPGWHSFWEEIMQKDIFALKAVLRWTPENPVTPEARIYHDGLQAGREEVISTLRGKTL